MNRCTSRTRAFPERCIFPLLADRDQRHREMPGSSNSKTTTAAYVITRPIPPSTARSFCPRLLETEDFLRFKLSTLNGPEVRNKGFALFPRKIAGLCDALATGQREHFLDVLRHAAFLVQQGVDPQADVSLGICAVGQLRLADRNRSGLARAQPWRGTDAEVFDAGGLPPTGSSTARQWKALNHYCAKPVSI